jgi:hypothetical protein
VYTFPRAGIAESLASYPFSPCAVWSMRIRFGEFPPHPSLASGHLIRQEFRVLSLAGFRTLLLALLLAAVPMLAAAEGGVSVSSRAAPSYILIGFVGGFVRHTNAHHGPVKLAKRLRQEAPRNSYIQVFENRRRKSAYRTIVRLLDSDQDGVLSDEEKTSAHIMLFGQSWGGSAVVLLARDLDRLGIPVMLTVQVDSVPKLWQNDKIIPGNVAAAANFYQPHGLIHGRKLIKAEDDSRTQILGNYRFDYRQAPVHCEGYSWFDRIITPSHMQSECDPNLWSQVDTLMRHRMEIEPQNLALNPEN